MDKIEEQRIEALWCVDSETGEFCLIDLPSGTVLIRQKENPHENA
jgi:hypothetical protein